MRYALIGCGRVSPNHIAAALDNGLEIVALCDLEIEKAAALRAQYALPDSLPLFADYHEMLRVCQPELVAVATFSGTHASIAVDCIEAGCHVIIEKPIALSLADADRIIEAEKRMGVKVCANHQNRFNAAVQQMRAARRAGRFGKILYGSTAIRWSRGEDYYRSADWRGTWAQDGGTLMNQCIHAIDLLRWMLGNDVTEVIGMTDNLQKRSPFSARRGWPSSAVRASTVWMRGALRTATRQSRRRWRTAARIRRMCTASDTSRCTRT